MKRARANGILKDMRSHINDALGIETSKEERTYITVETRSSHANGMVVMKEIVVKIKIDEW